MIYSKKLFLTILQQSLPIQDNILQKYTTTDVTGFNYQISKIGNKTVYLFGSITIYTITIWFLTQRTSY